MIGPLTIGRKAAKYGYKRYGVPGAVVAGAGGVGGYVFVKRKLTGGSSSDTEDDDAIETTTADGTDGTSETNGADETDAPADTSESATD